MNANLKLLNLPEPFAMSRRERDAIYTNQNRTVSHIRPLKRSGSKPNRIALRSRTALAFYVALVLSGCHEKELIPAIQQAQVDAVGAEFALGIEKPNVGGVYASYLTETVQDVTPIVKSVRAIQAHPKSLLAAQLTATAEMLERHREDRIRQGVWPVELTKLKTENISEMFDAAVKIAEQ